MKIIPTSILVPAIACFCLSSAYSSTSVWTGDFAGPNWEDDWDIRTSNQYGQSNQILTDDLANGFSSVLQVNYPANSSSNSYAAATGNPIGGTQFLTDFPGGAVESAILEYNVRFANNFQFVQGGKLPGLYGGTEISGGNVPDGTNGVSTRLMWRSNGEGEVYAYLPESTTFGTSIDRGNFSFSTDQWHEIKQEVVLNTANATGTNTMANGILRLWVDNILVIEKTNMTYRTVDSLDLEGVFFSTFFGGASAEWATPVDTHTQYADFKVTLDSSPTSVPEPGTGIMLLMGGLLLGLRRKRS